MPYRKTGFYSYHPFTTYETEGSREFLHSDGTPSLAGWGQASMSEEVALAFSLGEKAYKALLDVSNACGTEEYAVSTPQEFDAMVAATYLSFVRQVKENICELIESKKLTIVEDGTNEAYTVAAVSQLERSEALFLSWQLWGQDGQTKKLEHASVFREMFLFAALEELGHIIVSVCIDGADLGANILMAHRCYDTAMAIESSSELVREVKANAGKKGAAEKHSKHTEPDKALVHECWLEWQANPGLYKNKVSFDRDMLEKMQRIEDIRTVTRWRIELQKERTSC